METVSSQRMFDSISVGFRAALSQTPAIVEGDNKSAAGRLSSKFVYEVACAIQNCLFPNHSAPTVIGVSDDGGKSSGEWLVDALVSEESCHRNPHSREHCVRFVDRIVFAMESESDPGTQAFNDDFAKLIHLDASVKLYLNGLNQTTKDGMESYIRLRREYAEKLIGQTRSAGQWFMGFWPSPAKLEGYGRVSAWECLPCHLRTVRLFEFRGKFVEVHGSNDA